MLKSKEDNSATLLSLLVFFSSLLYIWVSLASALSPYPISDSSRLLFETAELYLPSIKDGQWKTTQSTQRKLMQAQGGHANSTQEFSAPAEN